MGGYITNFTVYTMAMIGLICFAIFVYKKFTDGTMRGKDTKRLSIEESMSLNPRKTLHIVKAGNERFLIASDVDRTTLISKLSETQDSGRIEDLERFRQIEEVEPEESFSTQTVVEPARVQTQQEQKYIHLEPLKGERKRMRKGMDTKENLNPPKRSDKKMVNLDYNYPQNHGFTTMKELAAKINEL